MFVIDHDTWTVLQYVLHTFNVLAGSMTLIFIMYLLKQIIITTDGFMYNFNEQRLLRYVEGLIWGVGGKAMLQVKMLRQTWSVF